MNFSINKIFNRDECNNIIDFCMMNGQPFKYNENDNWDCRRVFDEVFIKSIINKIDNQYIKGNISFWFDYKDFVKKNILISLTKYYDGRYLNLHRDMSSNYTTVILLSDNFEDGDFLLSSKYSHIDKSEYKIHLDIGQSITFEGDKTYHGVAPVTQGVRCALNIWMNNSDISYHSQTEQNKVI